jgi:hypothetical protein
MVPPETDGVAEGYTGDGTGAVAVRDVQEVRRPIWVIKVASSEEDLHVVGWKSHRCHHLYTPEAL